MDANTRRDNDRSGRGVALEDATAEIRDAKAAEAGSPLTKIFMVQEKVHSVLLTLLLRRV